MRPYFAILQDSFREALASRTLQALLGLICVLLFALAVPGLRLDQPAGLRVEEVSDPDGLAALLGRSRSGGLSPAQQSLRERLSPALQAQFVDYRRAASPQKRDQAVADFVSEYNSRLALRPLYDAEAWQGVPLTAEGRKLLAQPWDELPAVSQARLNRLLLDGALNGYLRTVEPVRVYLTYLVGEVELPVPPEAAHTLVQSIVYLLLKWFVGAAGMLAAVIFTASIIPQMFEPGAIDLLLSKPVSRSGAFLTRFCGGCAFILLNAGLFVIGLWLILGLRHNVWNARVLLAVPVFLLAFMIYFSISAWVGVRWRNPILAIALTLVAWIGTFSLHQLWYWGQRVGLDGLRAEVILPTASGPIVACKSGEVLRWHDGEWQTIFDGDDPDPALAVQRRTGLMYPLLGPVLVGSGAAARLVAIERRIIPPIHFSLGDIITGTAADNWNRRRGPAAPQDAVALFATTAGDAVLVTRSGIRRLSLSTDGAASVQLENLGPEGALWQEPVHAAHDRTTDEIGIYTRGRVVLLAREPSGRYAVQREHLTNDPSAALLGLGPEIILARAQGLVQRFDRGTLAPLPGDIQLPDDPQRIEVTSDGRFTILDHSRRLHSLRVGTGIVPAEVRGQGSIAAVSAAPDGRLFVADRYPRITAYSAQGDVVETWEHSTGFARVFLWVIDPLRTVLPKPDELDLLVREAVGANDDGDPSGGDDLAREREHVDLWTPVWTSGLFVIVVLGLTCWSIERRDF